jgi:hypothetical protein
LDLDADLREFKEAKDDLIDSVGRYGGGPMSMVGGAKTEDDKGSSDDDAAKTDQESGTDKEIEKGVLEAEDPEEENKKDAG